MAEAKVDVANFSPALLWLTRRRDLSFNQFSGTFPPSLGQLASLTRLYAYTAELCAMRTRDILHLTSILCNLVITIVYFYFSTHRCYRDVQENSLEGNASSFSEAACVLCLHLGSLDTVFNCTLLETLILSNNFFSGVVDERITQLSSLSELYVYS